MRTILLGAATIAALAAAPAHAQIQAGDVLMRVRAIVVAPNESSGAVTGIAGSRVGVGDSFAPELDFTYMATDHIGAELILGTTKHDITGRGTIGGLGKIGSTWALPPTLTLQYHFMPKTHIRPYLGAGINYTIFHSSKTSDSLNDALGDTRMHLTDSFGYAVQGGVDVDITKRFFLNLDVKYIGMKSTARLTTGAALNTVRVNIDPIVAGVGFGLRL